MKILCEINNTLYSVLQKKAQSIAIPLQFDKPQVNFFGAPLAKCVPFKTDQFIGDITAGGSCNVDEISLIPHCNGTHTETIWHISSTSKVSVPSVLSHTFYTALLVTVEPQLAENTEEYYSTKEPHDRIITQSALLKAIKKSEISSFEALVIRSLPNEENKRSYRYSQAPRPAYLSKECMDSVLSLGVRHLLVDLPSIDKSNHPELVNHRQFWEVTGTKGYEKTITELIYVNSQIQDGLYLLNLQIPEFALGATPSRPVLIPLEPQ